MQAENELLQLEPPVYESQERLIKQLTSVAILLVSVCIGLVGNLLFYGRLPGINLPLFVGLFLVGGAALLYTFQREIAYKNAIFALPALVFALALSVYAAPQLVIFNSVIVVVSVFLVVRYATNPLFIGGHWIMPIVAAIEMGIVGWIEAPLTILHDSNQWFKRMKINHQHATLVGAVLRGLMITLPILLVFGILLASADAIFGDMLSNSLSWLLPDNLNSLIAQAVLISFLTWLTMVLFKVLLFGQFVNPPMIDEKRKPTLFSLSMIETGMVLGSVDALFFAFVVVQAKYLFGGESNITVQGYTYSEYARRGFFELLAVSAMTMALVVVLDWLTLRHPKQDKIFRVLTFGLIGLTVVMLVAAFMRLDLYEDAYGFTRLRVMTKVFMVWLALLFAILVADIVIRHKRIFWVGCMVTGMGFVLSLNVMNLDGFIASHNIDYYEATGKLDIPYLLTLSNDAIPTIAVLLEDESLSESNRNALLTGLGSRLYKLDKDKQDRGGWLGYHHSTVQAWEALDAYRDELKPYIRLNASYYR